MPSVGLFHHVWLHLSRIPLLALFMAQRKPDIPFLFPDGLTRMDVLPWAQAMTILDHHEDPCYVEKIEYCKCQNGKQHEFLLVAISHGTTGRITEIVVDRSPKPPPTTGNQSSSRTAQMSSSSIPANDQVVIKGSTDQSQLTSPFIPFDTIATLTFGVRPALLDFATALVVIHQHASTYNPVDHQCYWFANTIWGVFSKAKYGPQIREGDRWDRRGMYSSISIGKDSQIAIEDNLQNALLRVQQEANIRRGLTLARENAVCVAILWLISYLVG
jgi:hypothetical protein